MLKEKLRLPKVRLMQREAGRGDSGGRLHTCPHFSSNLKSIFMTFKEQFQIMGKIDLRALHAISY